MDERHTKGSTVHRQGLINWVRDEFQITISKTTMTSYLKKLGLTYRATKPRKRTLQSYRLTMIRDYLIKLNDYYDRIRAGEDLVLVFMDESYVHNTHASRNSFVPEKENHINRSVSKGRRLVILHAITDKGPLTERDSDGKPVSDLVWKNDNCSSQTKKANEPGKINCETLWVAQCRTGDYHDNMNSAFFFKWLQEKLLPCFEKTHPSSKMVMIADNAPYHHSREVGSLASLKNKKELVTLMEKWECNGIEIPLTSERVDALEDDDVEGVTDMGSCAFVEFDAEEFQKRASKKKGLFVPTVKELQIGFAKWLYQNKPEALKCKVETLFKEKGFEILWTPPYCPDLQPIETFWGIGKNRVASRFFDQRTMKETVQHLQEGWYGNHFGDGPPPDEVIKPVNCEGLVRKSIKAANDIFIPMCASLGLSGQIGSLEYSPPQGDEQGEEGASNFPIDLVVGNLGALDDESDDETE